MSVATLFPLLWPFVACISDVVSPSNKLIVHEFPFLIRKSSQHSATINSGDLNLHYAPLSISNVIDLIRVRVRLDSKVEEQNVVQVSCHLPGDSISFYLPSNSGATEVGGMLGGILKKDLDANGEKPEYLTVTISSRSKGSISYTLFVRLFDRGQYNIELPSRRKMIEESNIMLTKRFHDQRSSAMEPLAFRMSIDRHYMKSLSVVINSSDDLCAVFAVMNATRHIVQTAELALLLPFRILFTRRAAAKIPLDTMAQNFSLMIFTMEEDTLCNPSAQWRERTKNKVFDITFSPHSDPSVAAPVSFTLIFYFVVSILFVLWYRMSKERKSTGVDAPLIDLQSGEVDTLFGQLVQLSPASGEEQREPEMESSVTVPLGSDHQSLDEPATVPQPAELLKEELKSSKGLLSYVIMIPVGFQLLYTFFEERMRTQTDEDSCYRNFDCSNSVGPFRSFNSVFSNVGYLALGALFVSFVRFRASKYDENKCVGVKPCFGILYGVGFALIAEAFASSLYHVCPNSTAFHFDTPFIEIMCALAMAQLYSTRRNFSQFSSVVLAGAVMTYHCVVDLISGSAYLKYFLLSFHLIFIFFLKAKIFLGPMLVYDILHPVSSVQSIFSALKNSGQSRLQTKRIILFTCSLAVNVALIVVLFWMPVLPQSYSPLCFIVTNMFLYFIYYILNKVMCGESLSISSCVCLSLSIFLWALSAFFFMHSETNWLDTSAQSRAYNDECVLLGFYDWHDIWHFSSSFASFFSLLTLTFLDDDLAAVERDQIVVF